MMIPNLTKKQSVHNIALYLRLSKDDGDKEESESISNQRAIILDYINEKFNYERYVEYIDDGISGATFNRPGFRKMLSELKKNNIDLIITKNLARFGRNYIEAGEYIEKIFPNNKVRYIAILDGVDNYEDKISNEFAPIKGVFNELFCKETSKGVKRTKRRKMKEGLYFSNTAPFGYQKDEENPGKLIIDKKASKIIKRIFDLTVNGKTAKEIADIFNKEKVITPAEYLKIRGLENRTKKIWTRSMIARILNNRVYIGDVLRGKSQNVSYKSKKRTYIKREEQIITKNTHKSIISEDVYNKIHNNSKYGKSSKKRNNYDTKFINYMYCGICKSHIAKRMSRNHINIHCKYRNETEYICSNNNIYIYEKIEEKILEYISSEFQSYFKRNNVPESLIKKYKTIKINQIDDKLKDLNKELGLLKFRISKLYNDRLQECISEQNYKKKYNELILKRKELSQFVENLQEEKYNFEMKEDNIDKIKKILENIKKDSLTEEDIDELIDRIEIYKNYVHIYFKFKTN